MCEKKMNIIFIVTLLFCFIAYLEIDFFLSWMPIFYQTFSYLLTALRYDNRNLFLK